MFSNLDHYGDGHRAEVGAPKRSGLLGDDAELAAFRSWINRARPAQLIGFLLKAAAMRVMGGIDTDNPPAQALLAWGEMDWGQPATRPSAN